MNKPDLALNSPQWLMCHKTKPNPGNVECPFIAITPR